MRGAILIATALTLGLSLSASAVPLPPGLTWGEQLSDTFANATNGVNIAGVVATGGGAWSDDGLGEWTGYDDGGNMVLQAKNRTLGTGYRYAYVFGAVDPLTTTGAADINRQSFRAKYIGGTNTRADRGFLTNWNGGDAGAGSETAYGSDAGGGFAFYGSAAPAVAGIMGSADFGITGSPAGSYANAHIAMIGAGLTTGWHQYDQLIYRNDVGAIPAGTSEWYIDDVLVQTNAPAATGEWVLGGVTPLGTPSRFMRDFEFWGPGRDITGTYSMLIDDISIQYSIPEPASLSLLVLGALSLIVRRRHPLA